MTKFSDFIEQSTVNTVLNTCYRHVPVVSMSGLWVELFLADFTIILFNYTL